VHYDGNRRSLCTQVTSLPYVFSWSCDVTSMSSQHVAFNGQTFTRNTLYSTSLTISPPILWDWRRVEIIKRSKQMICKDRRRLDPRLKAWTSFCTSQRDEQTNLIFFMSLGISLIHQHVCCGMNPWFGNQTTAGSSSRAYRDISVRDLMKKCRSIIFCVSDWILRNSLQDFVYTGWTGSFV
jgi:hypothetical protein